MTCCGLNFALTDRRLGKEKFNFIVLFINQCNMGLAALHFSNGS